MLILHEVENGVEEFLAQNVRLEIGHVFHHIDYESEVPNVFFEKTAVVQDVQKVGAHLVYVVLDD